MKLFFLSAMTLLLTLTLSAQSAKDELDVIQTVWGKNKKALTLDFLALSAEEASKFGPIYDEYLESRKKIAEVRANGLQTFSANQGMLDNATSQKLVTSLMKNNNNLAKLQTKTFKKLSKSLSPAKAAQWWQLESYIDAEIRAAILGELPLLQPVRK